MIVYQSLRAASFHKSARPLIGYIYKCS